MGKGKNALPPIDDSILDLYGSDENSEVKPGLVQIKTHKDEVLLDYDMLTHSLFAWRDTDSETDEEKSESSRGPKKKK